VGRVAHKVIASFLFTVMKSTIDVVLRTRNSPRSASLGSIDSSGLSVADDLLANTPFNDQLVGLPTSSDDLWSDMVCKCVRMLIDGMGADAD